MIQQHMQRSFKAIASLLIVSSVGLTACTTPPPSPATPPHATVAVSLPTAVAAAPVPTPNVLQMDVTTSSVASPDGRWVAETTVALPKSGDSYYTNLTVTESTGPSRWSIVDAWAPYGLGYTVPRPFQWSSDGRYLYITNEPVADGCALFVNGSDLQRVDLSSGEVTQIVEPVGLWLSLSPDETKLAYLSWGEDRPLVVRDLASGAKNAIKLPVDEPNWQAGSIVWSPDSDTLVLTVANSPCSGGWAQSTSIVQVDLATLEASLLLEDDDRLFVTTEWPEPSTIVLQDQNGQQVKMSASTGQIEQNAATGTFQGHVTIGPLQPVVRVDEPTPVVPPEVYTTRQIIVYAEDGQTEVARVQIGPDGNYSVALAPGAYVVDIGRAGIDSSKGLPAKVQIAAGQTTTLDVEIDTGIR